MNTNELIEFLANSDKTAGDLLNELNPNHKRRFLRLISSMQDLIFDIQKAYPDANYYVQEDSVLLMLGSSHSTHSGHQPTPNRQLMAVSDGMRLSGLIDGGGW